MQHLAFIMLIVALAACAPMSTPTPTATSTPLPTATATPAPTRTATDIATDTAPPQPEQTFDDAQALAQLYDDAADRKVILSASYVEGGQDKRLLLIESTLDDGGDFGQAAFVDAAVFVWRDSQWHLADHSVGFAEVGNQGYAPPVELVKIGPDKQGVVFHSGAVTQGMVFETDVLATEVDGQFRVVLRIKTHESNGGACARSDECYEFNATLELVRGDDPVYDDIRVTTTGTRLINSKATLFTETHTYAFSGKDYRETFTSVTPTPQPVVVSPFQQVATIDPVLLGDIVELRPLPGDPDYLQLITTRGYATLRRDDGRMTHHVAREGFTVIGVDRDFFIWMVNDNGDAIYATDTGNSDRAYGAESGWTPVTDVSLLAGRGVVNDRAGSVWLATDQDVRRFDGERWTVFTPQDMNMPPPAYEDVLPRFTLAYFDDMDVVFVGECDWSGPGPVGGRGARWFTGQAWFGADDPIATGCVTALKDDAAGHMWVALGGDLWRLAPARDVWEQFTPPVPPDAARIGYTIDLAIDPDGNPWPRVSLCGGASCDIGALRYRFSDGVWTPIGEIHDAYRRETIVFQPPVTWFFDLGESSYGAVVRMLTGKDVLLDLAEGFDVYAATIDADGRVWVVGKLPNPRFPMAIWIALEG